MNEKIKEFKLKEQEFLRKIESLTNELKSNSQPCQIEDDSEK